MCVCLYVLVFVCRPYFPIYRLDSSELSKWQEDVLGVAAESVRAWLARDKRDGEHSGGMAELPHQDKLLLPDGEAKRSEGDDKQMQASGDGKWTRHVCELCGGKVIVGDIQWRAHEQSRGHRRRRSSKRQKAQKQQQKQAESLADAVGGSEDDGLFGILNEAQLE